MKSHPWNLKKNKNKPHIQVSDHMGFANLNISQYAWQLGIMDGFGDVLIHTVLFT